MQKKRGVPNGMPRFVMNQCNFALLGDDFEVGDRYAVRAVG